MENITDEIREEEKQLNFFVIIGIALISPTCVFLNALLITAIWKKKSLHTNTNILVASMAITDFLVGIINCPLYLMENLGIIKIYYQCLVIRCITTALLLVSLWHLLVIAVDRFIVINYPLRHFKLFGGKMVAAVLVCVWTFSLLMGFSPLLGWRSTPTPMLTPLPGRCGFDVFMTFAYLITAVLLWFLIPVTTMITLYALIYTIARNQIKKIRRMNSIVSNLPDDRRTLRYLSSERKATTVVCTVMGCFLLCMLPGLATILYEMVTGQWVPMTLSNFAWLMVYANSALNPVIISFMGNAQIRRAIKSLLCNNLISPGASDHGQSMTMGEKTFVSTVKVQKERGPVEVLI